MAEMVTLEDLAGKSRKIWIDTEGRLVINIGVLDDEISDNNNSQLKVTPYESAGGEYKQDLITGAFTTLDYPHHEIHSGSHYFIKEVETLAMNAVLDIQFTPANTLKWPHWDLIFDTSSEYEFWLYEDVAINTPGTPQAAINRNRNSLNTAGMSVATIANTSIANANSDTAIAGATQLAHGKTGSGKQQGGGGSSRQELILYQNIPYSMRFLAVAAGYVNWLFDWYEHTNK